MIVMLFLISFIYVDQMEFIFVGLQEEFQLTGFLSYFETCQIDFVNRPAMKLSHTPSTQHELVKSVKLARLVKLKSNLLR